MGDERLAQLEAEMKAGFASMDKRLETLETAFTLGKGAAWAVTKLGLILMALATLGVAIWQGYRS